jgi:hypothetical protein
LFLDLGKLQGQIEAFNTKSHAEGNHTIDRWSSHN